MEKSKGNSEFECTKDLEKQLIGCEHRYFNKTVIITGGARGIGEGIARVFLKAGGNVVVSDVDARTGEYLVDELKSSEAGDSTKCLFVHADVRDNSDLQALVEATISRFGRIDCFVNNAGRHPPPLDIDDLSLESLQDLMKINFYSVFSLCKLALPYLRKVGGNIINISSWVGLYGQEKAVTYAATKGAICAFSKALAIDEAKHNVRVNIVCPGNIWTPMWSELSEITDNPDCTRKQGDMVQVLRRKGTKIEVGRLCLSIASDLTFSTGVEHIISGGAELGYGKK